MKRSLLVLRLSGALVVPLISAHTQSGRFRGGLHQAQQPIQPARWAPHRWSCPVVDETGLTGHDFELTIGMQTLMQLYAEPGVNVPIPRACPRNRR